MSATEIAERHFSAAMAEAEAAGQAPVINSTADARIPPDPSEGQEGWLKLTPETPTPPQET